MSDTKNLAIFSGERKDWQTWKKQRDGFKLIHDDDFDGYEGIPDPSKRERVATRYTVEDDEENDPTGAEPGEIVQAETAPQKKKKEKKWKKIDIKWYHIQYNALRGKGRALADDCDVSGAALEKIMDEYFDTLSVQHTAHNLKAWVAHKRPIGTSVEEHNAKWLEDCKTIEASMDWEAIKCVLYLDSLGDSHQSFFDIATNVSP